MTDSIIGTAIGAIVGAFVTWIVARYYYRQASDELRAEADRFASVIDGTFSAFEKAGWMRVVRDESGRPTAVVPRFGLRKPPSDGDA